MQLSSDKDINKRAKDLIKQGWRLLRKKRHPILVAPNGHKVVIATSPSDHRAYRNFQNNIRKAEAIL